MYLQKSYECNISKFFTVKMDYQGYGIFHWLANLIKKISTGNP